MKHFTDTVSQRTWILTCSHAASSLVIPAEIRQLDTGSCKICDVPEADPFPDWPKPSEARREKTQPSDDRLTLFFRRKNEQLSAFHGKMTIYDKCSG